MIRPRPLRAEDARPLLEINAAATPGVAVLDSLELTRLMGLSDRHLVAANGNDVCGYALVFRESGAYDGEEFEAFRGALEGAPFLYIDQVAVGEAHRGCGIGRLLYDAIDRQGCADGVDWLCCEVNISPPNPGSSAFHARMGFHALRRMQTADRREVDLLARRLDGPYRSSFSAVSQAPHDTERT